MKKGTLFFLIIILLIVMLFTRIEANKAKLVPSESTHSDKTKPHSLEDVEAFEESII